MPLACLGALVPRELRSAGHSAAPRGLGLGPLPAGLSRPRLPFSVSFSRGRSAAAGNETERDLRSAPGRAGLGRLLERPQVPERRQRLGGSGGAGAREGGQGSVRDGLLAARLARPGPPRSVTAACGRVWSVWLRLPSSLLEGIC